MSNLQVKDAAGANKHLKSSGAGTDADPYIPQHLESNSAAILTALGGPLTVSGAVTVAAGVVTTGGLTDDELRASPVEVSGTVATGALTDAQLRASAVPVSGPLTDTQLRAAAVPVSDGGGALTVDGTVTANPTPRTVTVAAGTAVSSGDNTLVAAPAAGQRIVLVSVQVQLEASTATVGLLKDGAAGGTLLRVRMAADGDGVLHQYAADARPRLTAATALVLNLSGANQCGYTVHYYTEPA